MQRTVEYDVWGHILSEAFKEWWKYLTEPLPGSPTSFVGKAMPLTGPSQELGASVAAGRPDRAVVWGGLAVLDAVGVGTAYKLAGRGWAWLRGKGAAEAVAEAAARRRSALPVA